MNIYKNLNKILPEIIRAKWKLTKSYQRTKLAI